MNLEDKLMVITGGSSGIGAAKARRRGPGQASPCTLGSLGVQSG